MMVTAASIWLGLVLLISIFAWFANRRLALFFLPFGAFIAACAIWPITGSPRFTHPPKGQFTVIGARIVPDVAIYILLADGAGEPVYYVLPYTQSAANGLQDAMNAAAANGGHGVHMKSDGQPGGDQYDGPPPVTGEEHKTPEAPEFSF